jgi:hypothetical protein
MPSKRTGYAPWSLTREAGVQSATVDGTIEVPQYLQPTIDTGFVDEKGNWQGRKSNDEVFIGITKSLAIPNSGEVLLPDTNNFPNINMTGFSSIYIALKPTRAGNYKIIAIMGPDTKPFANLTPVNAAATLKRNGDAGSGGAMESAFEDSAEALTADVWNIFLIGYERLANQKNMQFKIVNDSGGESDIEFGFMRVV